MERIDTFILRISASGQRLFERLHFLLMQRLSLEKVGLRLVFLIGSLFHIILLAWIPATSYIPGDIEMAQLFMRHYMSCAAFAIMCRELLACVHDVKAEYLLEAAPLPPDQAPEMHGEKFSWFCHDPDLPEDAEGIAEGLDPDQAPVHHRASLVEAVLRKVFWYVFAAVSLWYCANADNPAQRLLALTMLSLACLHLAWTHLARTRYPLLRGMHRCAWPAPEAAAEAETSPSR